MPTQMENEDAALQGTLHAVVGNGAVVREWSTQLAYNPLTLERVTEHNTAIRQQAAEIERLTAKIAEWEAVLVHHTPLKLRLDISEARTADLLKALERAEKPHAPGCGIGHGYKSHGRTKPMERVEHPCTCGLAAAKGEIV